MSRNPSIQPVEGVGCTTAPATKPTFGDGLLRFRPATFDKGQKSEKLTRLPKRRRSVFRIKLDRQFSLMVGLGSLQPVEGGAPSAGFPSLEAVELFICTAG